MKYLKIFALLLVTVFLSACSTIKKTASVADVNTYVVQYPTVADLEISPTKVSKTVGWSSFFSMISFETRKGNLTAELLQDNDADVLVEPQYIHNKNFLGTNKLTVIGFPAKLKNFRKATDKDLDALKCGKRDICEVSQPCNLKNKNKKKDKKKFLFF